MQFQRINRSDPEKVFISVRNNWSTAAITVGQAVIWDYVADADGVSVTRPVAGSLTLQAGIVESSSIAAESFGLIQIYGHNANALVSGGTDVVLGDPLILTTAKFFLSKATAITNGASASYPFTAGQAFTTAGGTAKKVFLRCL